MKAELVFGHGTATVALDENNLARRIEFLKSSCGVSSYCIANTDKRDRKVVHHWIETLRTTTIGTISSEPPPHICAQYSLKHHPTPRGNLSEKKQDFLQTLETEYSGADEILLVTGSHCPEPTRAWKTVDALSAFAETTKKFAIKIAVGYNPFHLDPSIQDRENARLLGELATGSVSRIYLQFGTDLDKLVTGIDFCKEAAVIMDRSNEGKSLPIVGSLFLPTPQRIAQQKSRPWKGVVLGSEFKSDSSGEQASALVSEMVKIYQKHDDIELLWEAPGLRTREEADVMAKILAGAASTNRETGVGNENRVAETDTDTGAKFEESKQTKMDSSFSNAAAGGDTKPKDRNLSQQNTATEHQKDVLGGHRSDDPCLLVFGSHDVRLQDNKALEEALKRHAQILPVFLYTQEEREGNWGCPQNTAAAVCLESALTNLQASLQKFGLPLVHCNGTTSHTRRHGVNELLQMVEIIGAMAVFWNKEATPEGKARHAYWRDHLEQHDPNIACYQLQSSLLYDVDKLELQSGFQHGHFGTLMPFLKKCTKDFGSPPRPTPYFETFRLLEGSKPPKLLSNLLVSVSDNNNNNNNNNNNSNISTTLSDLKLVEVRGSHKWDEPIRERFQMSEERAHQEMETFVRNGMKKYEKERSRADKAGATSGLSPHLRIGTLSPNRLYWRIEDSGLPYEQLKTISRRLIWRDLAYYHLFCFPEMRTCCIRRHYEQMEWVGSSDEHRRFEAWKKGMTGYPIVDAGMRELYATGWMTQSVRMVTASFLTEYLRVNWTKGCEWFHTTLVDADSAINAMMWQNAGRSGIDQWNFVLSPKTASQDPTGEYTKKWVPELAALPTINLVHRPWEATEEVLKDAGVVFGQTYPHRIVKDLKRERQHSIDSTLAMRRNSQEYNSDRGYDLIDLPNGKRSVVFTKKEYRIDEKGNLLKETDMSGKKTVSRTKPNRRKKRRKGKAAAITTAPTANNK